MFLGPKQSEMTAPSPAAGLPGESCEWGRAGSEPSQTPARCPLAPGPGPGASGTQGDRCWRCPCDLRGPGQVCIWGERVPLRGGSCHCRSLFQGQEPLPGAWLRARAGADPHVCSSEAMPPGHAHRLHVRPCVCTALALAGPSWGQHLSLLLEGPTENLGLGLGEQGPARLGLVST